MKYVIVFLAALLFGIGLGLSGMTQPQKVIGFLDIAGNWDPSLMFVMVGAILVHAISYRLITNRPSPVLAPDFKIPEVRKLDARLLGGATLFGIGWGLGGFCPGPAIVAAVGMETRALLFVGSMIVGMFIYRVFNAQTA